MTAFRARALGAMLAVSASFTTNAVRAAPPPSCATPAPPLGEDATADALFQRGVCEEGEGHLIAALKLYQTALRRPSSSTLARRLKVRSDEVIARLASVRIDASSLPDGATALVASKKYELGSKRFVDPGKVEIEVSAPGYVTRTVTVDVGEGEQRVVTVVLSPVTGGDPPPPARLAKDDSGPDPPPPHVDPPRPPSTHPWRSAGYVALGVGGASLIAGGVTGYLAFDRADEVQSECPTKTTCSANGAAAARAGATFSTVSTVTTISGALLAACGLALVLWGGPAATVRPSIGAMNGFVVTGKM